MYLEGGAVMQLNIRRAGLVEIDKATLPNPGGTRSRFLTERERCIPGRTMVRRAPRLISIVEMASENISVDGDAVLEFCFQRPARDL